MQTIFSPLPELEDMRDNTKTAPKSRARDWAFFPKTIFNFLDLKLQVFPRSDGLTLRRRPRPESTPSWSFFVILIRFFRGGSLNDSLDSYLSFQWFPEEHQSSAGVVDQFPGLPTFVVCVEHETTLIEPSQQHNAGGRHSVWRAGRKRHCLRLQELRILGFLKPKLELLNRICGDGRLVEFSLAVLEVWVDERHGHALLMKRV